MRLKSIPVLFVTLTGLAALPHRSGAGLSAFCSLDPTAMFELAPSTVFVGVATADSMPSGGWPRRVRNPFGNDTVVLQPPRYSQLVMVTRLSRRVSPELARTIREKGNRVLLIPWAYNADCSPASWDGPTLWIEPATEGLFGATLRPRDSWVNGVPTLDVGNPTHNPFPSRRPVFDSRGQIPLTPHEYLSFIDSISPISRERVDRIVRKRRELARFREIVAWAERHAGLADRYPVKQKIESARYQIAVAPRDTTPSPMAGTWRFTFDIRNYRRIVIYGRTLQMPTSFMAAETYSRRTKPPDNPYGYFLLTGFAADSAQLPSAWPRLQGYLAFAFEPVTRGNDSTVWKAGVDLLGIVDDLATDSAAVRRLMEVGVGPQRSYTPGFAVIRANGRATITVPLTGLDGELIATVRGERISAQYIPEG